MNKRHFLKLLGGSALTPLVGCDSGGPTSATDDLIVNSADRGIDMTFAAANPGAIAELPRFFLPGDTITHSNTPSFNRRQLTQFGTAGSYTVPSSGQLILHDLRFIYRRRASNPRAGNWTLSSDNRLQQDSQAVVNQYTELMDAVIDTISGSPNALENALGPYTTETPQALVDLASSIGLLTALGPESGPISGTDLPLVLLNRDIEYIANSTNQQLTNSNQISGTYNLIDTWVIPTRLAVEDNVENIDENDFDQITLSHQTRPVFVLNTVVDNNPAGFFTFNLS